MSPRPRALALFFALATCVTAVGLRAETLSFKATGRASSCTISEAVDCDAVQSSPYATLFGVSLSTLGAAASLAVLLLLLGAGDAGGHPLVAAGAVAAFNLGYAIYAASISAFVLHKVCLYCIGMQVGFALTAVFVVPAAWRAWKSQRPPLTGGPLVGTIAILAVVATLAVSGDAWADHRARYDRFFAVADGPAVRIETTRAMVLGDPSTPHTGLIYFDFGCPYCKLCHSKAVALVRAYPDKIHFVFKHYPLDRECSPEVEETKHRNACRAAAAGQAAQALGKSSDALAYLFDKQDFTSASIDELGRRLGTTPGEWSELLHSPTILALRQRDIAEYTALKANAVPMVYIDGVAVDPDRLVPIVERVCTR